MAQSIKTSPGSSERKKLQSNSYCDFTARTPIDVSDSDGTLFFMNNQNPQSWFIINKYEKNTSTRTNTTFLYCTNR